LFRNCENPLEGEEDDDDHDDEKKKDNYDKRTSNERYHNKK
jgi:hypothetical protein